MIGRFGKLIRPRVSLAVAAGAWFGALYQGGGEPLGLALAVLGAFLLCAGCSTLNQVQERDLDVLMERTRNRPLASGVVSVRQGVLLAVATSLSGLACFCAAGGLELLLLGAAIVVVYNGIYTPLKRVTPMALLVGGFAGAVPPMTGWLAAGGDVSDPRILAVTGIFYLWQVPHFWLLAEKHRRDYERAGFATLHAALSQPVRERLMVIWVTAYFVGLGCLAGMSGMAAAMWLIPPALLLTGGVAVGLAVTGRIRQASVALYVSLPVGLAPLVINSF